MIKKITKPHDRTFRQLMEQPRLAREFCEYYLPAKLTAKFDLSTLKLERTDFVDKQFSLNMSDVLLSVCFQGETEKTYILCEHFSQASRSIPLRMLIYCTSILSRCWDKDKSVPLIWATVFYHGKKPYTCPTHLLDLYDEQKREFAQEHLHSNYQLINADFFSDAILEKQGWIGAAVSVFKHIYDKELLNSLSKIIPRFREIEAEGGGIIIEVLLKYIFITGDVERYERLVKMFHEVSKTTGEKAMTIAERLRAEGEIRGEARGEARGVEKATRQIALALLKRNNDLRFIKEVTGLSLQQVATIREAANTES